MEEIRTPSSSSRCFSLIVLGESIWTGWLALVRVMAGLCPIAEGVAAEALCW